MSISIGEVIVWVIIGLLAGSIVGMIVTRSKQGYGRFTNLGLGMIGAVVGGFLFNLLNINLGFLETLQFTFEDLLAAIIGSLIVLGFYTFLSRRRRAVAAP